MRVQEDLWSEVAESAPDHAPAIVGDRSLCFAIENAEGVVVAIAPLPIENATVRTLLPHGEQSCTVHVTDDAVRAL